MILKTNILLGIYYGKGEILNLLDEGKYYNKYLLKNDCGDRFLLYLDNKYILKENSIISFEGDLKLPDKQRNRGGFDYSKYMYSQNIYASIFVNNYNNIEILEDEKFNLITFIQNNIFEKLNVLLPKEELGILIGMIMGDTFYIEEEIEEDFKLSGITHLLAVSGSNVAYIILVSKFLFDKVLGKSISNFITILMIILFVLISGASPSVVRAGIMAIILIVSEILARQPDTKSSIAVAAFLILLYNPFVICDVGFILSFGGTLGIVLLNTKIIDKFNEKFYLFLENKIFKYVVETLSVTLAAQLILVPVIWYYFNNISLISIITNLLVAPFTGIITVLGLIIYFISFICNPLAQIFSYSVYFLISIMIFVSKICANIPYGNIMVPTPNIMIIIEYYLILYYFFGFNAKNIVEYKFIGRNNHKTNEKVKRKYLKIIISLLTIMQIMAALLPENHIEINVIDVGQGDSILIKSTNSNILIDGGGSENSDYDVGSQILVPYLLDNTNGEIDLMIISHFHEDHAEGCISVLENLNVKKIVIGTQPQRTALYEKVLKIGKGKNIPIITLKTGDKIAIDDINFEIIYPNEEIQIKEDLNNNSLVIKMNYFETTMLLTGDIEKEAEKILLSENLDIDILKVAHHGSKSSTTDDFLNLTTPKIALISVATDNKFGHPHTEVIKRLEDQSCKIYRTDECGEISLKIYENGFVKILTLIK